MAEISVGGQSSWNIKLRRLGRNLQNTATINRHGKKWAGVESNEMTQRQFPYKYGSEHSQEQFLLP
jgi:precorrin-6B methylase 1